MVFGYPETSSMFQAVVVPGIGQGFEPLSPIALSFVEIGVSLQLTSSPGIELVTNKDQTHYPLDDRGSPSLQRGCGCPL